MDARGLGFEVTLVEDACREIDLDGSHAAALDRMGGAGVRFVRSATIG
jgi:nicotinamidase/pyrazinamidase